MAANSRSVPMLLTPGSGNSTRRPSTCSIGSFGGIDSRRSSVASIGSPLGTPSFKTSRRPSALISNSSSGNLLQQFSSGVVSTVSIESKFYLVYFNLYIFIHDFTYIINQILRFVVINRCILRF